MADGSSPFGTIMIFAIVLVLVAMTIFFAQRYKRCPPDKIMVVYGRTSGGRASRTIHGGATLVWPLIQDYSFLSLTPITINIDRNNVPSRRFCFPGKHDRKKAMVIGSAFLAGASVARENMTRKRPGYSGQSS